MKYCTNILIKNRGLLLILFVCGCAATSIVSEGKAPSRGKSKTEPDVIRVAVRKHISRLELESENAVLIKGSKRLNLPSPTVMTVEQGTVIVNGMTFSSPVSIQSRHTIRVDGSDYYGNLLIQDNLLINILPMDEYLNGVLAAEVPQTWPIEALKAQAVVSRTYAYRKITQNRGRPFDVEATAMNQKYDFTASSNLIRKAVYSTANTIILYRNEPIEAFFHSCSGGRTENCRDIFQKDLPYLRSIPDPYCVKKDFLWTFSSSADAIKAALKDFIDPDTFPLYLRDIKIQRRTGSGRVREFLLIFDNNRTSLINGNSFRLAVDPKSLKSLLIQRIEREKRDGEVFFGFYGRGYGHGVGMSQWGAYEMALMGFNYKHIISHYYRGTRISTIWDIR